MKAMRVFGLALGIAIGLLAAYGAGAQESTNFGGGRPEDRYFSVDASVASGRHGPMAQGYVVNRYDLYATRVGLVLRPIDATGRALAPVRAWVYNVPANQRTFFTAALPPATARVEGTVESFEWAGRGGGGGGM
jgi:hypothetical protein